ncbi:MULTISPECIES: LodA/GoxA family CTQ-dependent oxidase [Pseudoalteromonas]|uniref:L-lysine 6-oxidase n=1 Tax=Pseudoalteromonas ruthenica TaxID=151081 RepID=A0A0F4PR39_9GAMM|nr:MULTISPECIES: LodA/GoxA family CTQ-dependent oxidase [Pseudoalteromonas]KJY97503.1 hypothetical protein TW72_14450 [Pseudoalteromonas ruthenica]KJZ00922.1 hypothetical protein TW76_01645 [Pseudoalteromonas ruthenica]MCF2863230.1 LodA/GoxA family CTQ-dependent oxidase [Pseudoalteromonas sp. CNAT2-18]MCG7559382.1 LodA/GoxA family CTQ-dependent oxidase [Pseudoalteromonas sp. CNAT2-18.1]MCG7571451.1 LodA/GoxA family CTQ-dependent oxidase [Pseudoalteromonas sp. CNC9-20]
MSTNTIFRVHPAINFARVGNSEEFYIAPETAAGELLDKSSGLFGGLPIKWGSEATPITADDFRDQQQRVKRQAARFRIYAYDEPQSSYPSNDKGREITLGDTINGKTVSDIIWQVHVANKKNNNFTIADSEGNEEGINSYTHGQTPPLRNPTYGLDPNMPERLLQLVIDPGPRCIRASDSNTVVHFDAHTTASYIDQQGQIQQQPNYPTSFPSDHFDNLNPSSGDITTLGELRVESNTGRLVVTGGYGNAFAFKKGNYGAGAHMSEAQKRKVELNGAIDNDGWFDDVADGPVHATIVFDDGSTAQVVAGWFVSTDPAYAPQTRNIVSTWDDIFNTWVEHLNLIPDLYSEGQYNSNYKASFNGDVLPILHGAFLQRWNTNLPNKGIQGHNFIAKIKPSDNPKEFIKDFDGLIRNPNLPADDSERTKMPLSLGDATKSFLSLSTTQYFLMKQWYEGHSEEQAPNLGEGEKLDKVVLENCLGGRYSPGIELTFIVRDTHLYKVDNSNGVATIPATQGPFRINEQPLDYSHASKAQPFLSFGYIPNNSAKVTPGDLSKFMAQPWHTDYNSCAVHEPDPVPPASNTLYWSWPAQRPVQVHPANLCTFNEQQGTWNLGGQLFSIRGDADGEDNLTYSDYPQNVGRYRQYLDYLANWHKTGFIIQGHQVSAPKGDNYGSDKFVEVESLYQSNGQLVQPWPTSVIPEPTSK